MKPQIRSLFLYPLNHFYCILLTKLKEKFNKVKEIYRKIFATPSAPEIDPFSIFALFFWEDTSPKSIAGQYPSGNQQPFGRNYYPNSHK